MSEKEERILISTRHYDEETKMTYTDMYREYSRQEAIECIAKALCKHDVGGAVGCKLCKFAKDKEKCEAWIEFNQLSKAEVAIDALLSLHG